ncbi:MAG: helix-turn-helix domain-containing protein [Roseibium sp.]
MDHIKKRSETKDHPPPVAFLLNDPNQFKDLSGWDMELRQIERGPLDARVSVWAGRDLTMIDTSFNRSMYQVGVSKKGVLAFGLPDPQVLSHWLGRTPKASSVMTFGNEDPFDGISLSNFSGVSFGIEIERAEQVARKIGVEITENLKRSTFTEINDASGFYATLRLKARQYISERSAPLSQIEEEDLIVDFLEMLASLEPQTCKDDSRNRTRVVKNAVEVMNAALTDNVPISEICAEVGVSVSTLRRAFHEVYGIGPKQFYLKSRLNKVRSELARRPQDVGISDVANSYGFWHQGQFAKDYRQLFGTRPSSTVGLS